MRNILINPMINKEFKLRFRSGRTFFGLAAYLVAIGIVVIGFIFLEGTITGQTGFIRPEESQAMFIVLSSIQLVLVLFITPGLTAGIISGERERQTLSILLTTAQSSTGIILSKLFSSISFLVLLIMASLPFYSLVFLFGGVSPLTIVKVMGFYLFTIFAMGSIGVLLSTLIRRTIISMIATYGITLFFSGGTAFLFMISLNYNLTMSAPGSVDVLSYIFASLSPPIVFFSILNNGTNEFLAEDLGISFPIIWTYLFIYLIIAIVLLSFSIRKLRPKMKSRLKRSKG